MMGGGYTMLALAALVLLMIAVLNANRIIVSADIEPAKSEMLNEGAALAETMLGEIRTKKFDENARDSLVQATTDFSIPPLGRDGASEDSCAQPDTGSFQSIFRFDDIDDYNGYTRIVNTPLASGYVLTDTVYYVSATDYTQSSSRTFLKKIEVTVRNPGGLSAIKFSTIQSY